jgi:hypothetical protein
MRITCQAMYMAGHLTTIERRIHKLSGGTEGINHNVDWGVHLATGQSTHEASSPAALQEYSCLLCQPHSAAVALACRCADLAVRKCHLQCMQCMLWMASIDVAPSTPLSADLRTVIAR